MAPLNQLSVLAFAGAALAVPHYQPFKRHAHPAAPPAYGQSSSPPQYGTSSTAGSSAGAVSSSGLAGYGSSGSAVVSSGYAHPTGGYSFSATGASTGYSVSPTGYSGSVSYSTCTETSTLIYRSTTEYSTYHVTHTIYPGTSSAGAGSASGYPTGGAGGAGGYSASGSAVSPAGSGFPGGYPSGGSGAQGATCASEVTVTTTEKSTVYVTATGGASGAASSSAAQTYPGSWEPAPSVSSVGAASVSSSAVASTTASVTYPATWEPAPSAEPSEFPGCWRLCFKQNKIESQSALCGNDAVSKCIHDNCSVKQDKAYWQWYDEFCSASSSSSSSPATSGPVSSSAPATYSAPAYTTPATSSAPAYTSPTSSVPAYTSPASTSASSPAPSASAPPGGYGGGSSGYRGKRGLAYNDASLVNMFSSAPAVGWSYNWIPQSGGLSSDIPYIPCLHDSSSAFTSVWAQAAEGAIANGGKWLFSMNEPDISTQANMSPTDAAAFWKQWMEPYAGKIGLVAPAVSSGVGPNMGADWLKQFLAACSDCTIDAVGQHWYNSNGNDVSNFQDTINAAAAFGKPVWVNEFGAIGSDSEISSFLEQVMPWMDSNDSVL